MPGPIDPTEVRSATVIELDDATFRGILARGLGLPDGGEVVTLKGENGRAVIFIQGIPLGSVFERDDAGSVRWAAKKRWRPNGAILEVEL